MVQTSHSGLGKYTKTYVVESGLVRHCHIKTADFDKPVAGIEYNSHFYSFFRVSNNWAEAEKISSRLTEPYVITPTKKGWVIWVQEY